MPLSAKVRFQQARPLEASAVERDHEEVQWELSVEASSDTEDVESEQQVVNLEGNKDEMTFLRGVTTRSGRVVKATSKYF